MSTHLQSLLPWDPNSRAQESGTGILFLMPHPVWTFYMTLTHHFLTIRYPLVQKGQCLAQGWSTPSHSLKYPPHTPLWCKSRFQSLTGNMSLSFFPSQPIRFPVSGGSPLTVLLLCFPLECDSVRGWVSVFVWCLHITVFEFTSEYTFELLCTPM